MNYSEVLSTMESFILENYSDILEISPVESLTPYKVQDIRDGKESFIFVAKCSPFIYEPFKGRELGSTSDIKISTYKEGTSLILRFEIFDVILETEIIANNLEDFTNMLKQSDKTTLAVMDANTYKMIWLTNTISTKSILFHTQLIL